MIIFATIPGYRGTRMREGRSAMELGLQGKVAAVAAASSGLGKAVALALAGEGMSVVVSSRDERRIRAAADAIDEHARRAAAGRGSAPPPALAVAADLATEEGPRRFIAAAEERFSRVDVLVANCGGPPPGPAAGLGEEEWTRAIPLTLLSAVRLARAALPGMRARRWGRIIFITSTSVKQPIENLALSTSLRSAVAGYAKSLSDELAGEGITVNVVAPGSIATGRLEDLLAARARDRGVEVDVARAGLLEKIPARRLGRPEELAAAVAFLASEPAAYISGVVLAVDGGALRSIT